MKKLKYCFIYTVYILKCKELSNWLLKKTLNDEPNIIKILTFDVA